MEDNKRKNENIENACVMTVSDRRIVFSCSAGSGVAIRRCRYGDVKPGSVHVCSHLSSGFPHYCESQEAKEDLVAKVINEFVSKENPK